jgi:hypothetical protein
LTLAFAGLDHARQGPSTDATFWTGSMMLEYQDEKAAADLPMRAVEHVCAAGILSPDPGGTALTRPVWGDRTTSNERDAVLAALAESGIWVRIHFLWRPNLPDEGDNHILELAIAGDARAVITSSYSS